MKTANVCLIVACLMIAMTPVASADPQPIRPPGSTSPGPFPCVVIDLEEPGWGIIWDCWGLPE